MLTRNELIEQLRASLPSELHSVWNALGVWESGGPGLSYLFEHEQKYLSVELVESAVFYGFIAFASESEFYKFARRQMGLSNADKK